MGGWESRAHLGLDGRVMFPMSLAAVGVAGAVRASVGCGGGGACWEVAAWRVPARPWRSCGALGTMVLEAARPWWCSAPSGLRRVGPPPLARPLQVDPPPWAPPRHCVAGRPPWARLACQRCCCSRQPVGVFWAVEASRVAPRSSCVSSHSMWACAGPPLPSRLGVRVARCCGSCGPAAGVPACATEGW